VPVPGPQLRIAFVVPAYWPAEAFGGPVWVVRALARELVTRGHSVDVWTTTLERAGHGRRRTRRDTVDGATVTYLGTPLRYRWMGFTPTLGNELARAPRPDVAHIFGFRDPIGFAASRWLVRHDVPYVFEALGMFRPKLRKQTLKRLLDATVLAALPRRAKVVIAASEVERREYLAAGIEAERIAVRPNGVPAVPSRRSNVLRERLGLTDEPLVLYVGRVAEGKGLSFLVQALGRLTDAHVAIIGPDEGHGTVRRLGDLADGLGVSARLHVLGQWPTQPLEVYADADVFALPSAHENFGMAAAEAAAAGVAVVVTDRCGVAELLAPDGAAVIPYDADALADALDRLLQDAGARHALGERGAERVAAYDWGGVAELQETLYRRAIG